MKKLSILALGVGIALGLSACKPASDAQNTAASTAVPAAMLNSGIDQSAVDKGVRAQDDFFRHVNGTWLAKTEIPADKSRYSMFNLLFDDTQENLKTLIQEASAMKAESGSNMQKLGDLYNSYMDEDRANQLGLSPLKTQLDEIAAVENMSQVTAQMGKLNRLGVTAPMGFYTYSDLKDPTTTAMYLAQSGLTLPDRDYYSKQEEKFVNFRAATVKYMADILSAAGQQNTQQAAEALMKLETEIAAKQVSRVESRDAEKNYNKRSVGEVQDMLKGFDWQAYADAIGVGSLEEVVVRNLPYFEVMGDIFSSTDVQVWKDYMTYNLIDTYAQKLNQDLVDLSFDFHSKTLNGIPEQRPRWKRAVDATSGLLGEVLGQQYVERHFTPEAKAKMDDLVKNLTSAYAASIKQLDWMSEETKLAAQEKLSKFKPKIGYPDKWRDYSALKIQADDLVGNYLRSSEFEHEFEIAKIGKPVDPTDWGMTPQTINAYYSPGRNEIVFPAAILQPPFFNMEADDAVNYGAIGAVIGHEIGHGFDDQGSKFDGDGNLRSWWTEQDRSAFDALGAKLIEQYSQFEPLEGQHVNGELTLGENIGDLAGVTIGYKAYHMSLEGKEAPVIDGLTGDQRFFMGYAQVWRGKYRDEALRAQLLSDPHSPAEYRVNGIVLNVDAYYKAFDVKEGDAMYLKPEDRVKIW
jgi:putative endopeptidase